MIDNSNTEIFVSSSQNLKNAFWDAIRNGLGVPILGFIFIGANEGIKSATGTQYFTNEDAVALGCLFAFIANSVYLRRDQIIDPVLPVEQAHNFDR